MLYDFFDYVKIFVIVKSCWNIEIKYKKCCFGSW